MLVRLEYLFFALGLGLGGLNSVMVIRQQDCLLFGSKLYTTDYALDILV